MARADADRSQMLWEVGAFSNLRLLGVAAALQLAMHQVPVAQAVFGLTPVSPRDCLLSITLRLEPVSLLEISKLYEEVMSHTAMRLRRMGIDTYRQPVVYMRSDCTICRAEGFEAQSLVEMHVADRSIVALLNIVTTDLLAHQEAGLSEVAWRMLGARDGDVVTFAHPPTLDSFGHVRAKMYGRPFDDAAFRAIVADVGAGRYTDAHIAAFLAACAGNRMYVGEMIGLTRALVEAGETPRVGKPRRTR